MIFTFRKLSYRFCNQIGKNEMDDHGEMRNAYKCSLIRPEGRENSEV
jgi:hypothetical protein